MQAFKSVGESQESLEMSQTTRKKPMQRVQTIFMVGLCSLFLFGQWGCAFDSAQPTQDPTQLASLGFLEEVQKQSGTVEVLSAPFPPQAKLEMPPGGVLGGFRRGAKVGTAFGGWPGAAGLDEKVVHPFLAIPLYAAGAIVGALLGGPYGAVASPSQANVQEAEETLKEAIATLQLQETLRDHVVKQMHQETPALSVVSTEREPTEGQPEPTA